MERNIPPVSPAPQKRAYALDALRGFAILTMILSGVIPRTILPAWMYHAQLPPPEHVFNPQLPGLTWVDLVFPFFLFSMGAAIPIAFARRIAKGANSLQLGFSILKRGFLLGSFAIFLQHIRPGTLDPTLTPRAWWLALLGFLILFFMFVRWPISWPFWLRVGLTSLGWIAGILLLWWIRYPDGTGFSLERSDIILVVLTNMAVFSSLIWLFTKYNWMARLGILALVFALRLSSRSDGWIALLWGASPIPWIFRFDYLKYLFVVIPGTIVGDLILFWLQKPTGEAEKITPWKIRRLDLLFFLLLAIIIVLLVGLQERWVWQTSLISLGLCGLGSLLLGKPTNEIENLIYRLYGWGVYWLFLGLLLEPFEGGIKKDSSTMSYYFITVGLAIFLLIAFTIIVEVFKQKQWLQLLIDNGQNPMIAYVGIANLIWPIIALTKLEPLILEATKTPITGLIRGVIYTLVLAYIVQFFTRKKFFWRT